LTLPLELPEIETIRRDLDREIAGKKIKAVEVSSTSVIEGSKNKKAFNAELVGTKLGLVERKGLYIFTELDKKKILFIKIGTGASIRRHATKDATDKDTVLKITFTVGGQLRIVDPKEESKVSVFSLEDLEDPDFIEEKFPEFKFLGMDPALEPEPWTEFAKRVLREGESTDLKSLLFDDSVVVGVGDVYSDEILFHAGLRHDRQSDSLSIQEVRRLYRSIVEVIVEAVKYRGTSIEEREFLDVFGEPGGFAEHLAVYGREGLFSPTSKKPVQKVKHKGRWTFFCETQV
tara:strand:+ start:33498 stop:34364 length:867 start_codon:yes stop_codon:yes gene_type:complete